MSPPAVSLRSFVSTPPRHALAQGQILEWLAAAHARSDATRLGLGEPAEHDLATRYGRLFGRCGCSPDRIANRGFSIPDVLHTRWREHALYDLTADPRGGGSAARTRTFAAIVDEYFAAAYAADTEPPDDLIHVTCTGYVSPSGPQKLLAARGWGTRSRVTHAYQMGCYAAVPAVRVAAGFLAAGSKRADLVHTELCSLHLDPSDHGLEQLVVQSLFADGLIRYAMVPDDGAPGLVLRGVHERVLADSAESMSWQVSDHGMHMTLARDVPQRIAVALREHVIELARGSGLPMAELLRGVFAVHPGGPRILDGVRDVLELAEPQLATSRAVLLDHGNMSSATLPHIWMRLLADPAVAPGTLVTSLAFGPGLTICGAVFEKR